MPSFSILFSIFTILLVINDVCRSEASDEGGSKASVTITKPQYCLSCKETVNLYAKLTAEEISTMQKTGKPAMSSLEANQLAHYICDNVLFDSLQPWMKYGCMKLMEDHYLDFLEQFAGQVSANDIANKAENFKRKRRVCGKIAKACHPSEFKRSNLTSSKRTNCNGCRLMAEDFESYYRAFKRIEDFETFLRESYCAAIGTNFYPYLWMEDICEEMIEDHFEDILSILKLQQGIFRSGLTPSESTPDMMCSEFYKCKKSKISALPDDKDLANDEL